MRACRGNVLRLGPLLAVMLAVSTLLPIASGSGASNQPPSFGSLDGRQVSIPPGGDLRINLSDYLVDADDAFANFTFAVAWDNGTVVTADLVNGTLVIHSVSSLAGHADVTVVATDPAGATARATVGVDAGGAALSGASLAFYFVLLLAAALLGGWLYSSYRKGRVRVAKFGSLEPEEAALEEGEESGSKGAPDLERTDEARMLGKLDAVEREAKELRIELPMATVLAVGGAAAASSLILLYRDGRPIAWVTTAAPTDAQQEKAQALAAVLAERALRTRPGERVEGETVQYAGRKIVFEGSLQLFLGAVIEGGADEAALRMRMRDALERVFDKNAGPLKRWDGSRGELKGIGDVLRDVVEG